jgi:hypothetical protein
MEGLKEGLEKIMGI